MQLTVQYSSELVAAIAIFIASALLVRFTYNRLKHLPSAERSLGYPLWTAASGIFLLGIASLLNYQHAIAPSVDLETLYYLVVVVGAGIFALAATMIMGWRKGRLLPLAITGSIIVVAILEQYGMGFLGPYTGEFTAVAAGILFGIPFLLFSYLTIKQKRITSFGFAVLAITYPVLLVSTTFTAPEIVAVILAIRLYGPALLITAMVLPETGIGGELMAYSFTISSAFYFMAYLLVSPLMANTVEFVAVSFLAIASILSIGTSAYTLTRWSKSRNTATLTLGVYFFIGGFSFLTVALNHTEFIVGPNAEYVALMLGIIAPMVLNLSSIMALDWRQILLLPLLITFLPFYVMMNGWLAGIAPDAVAGRALVMAISGLLHSVIPIALYGVLWWRMRKAGAPGRSRALFLALGVFLLIFGTAGGNTIAIIPAMFVMSAFAVWWIGVTGRADRLLGTLQ